MNKPGIINMLVGLFWGVATLIGVFVYEYLLYILAILAPLQFLYGLGQFIHYKFLMDPDEAAQYDFSLDTSHVKTGKFWLIIACCIGVFTGFDIYTRIDMEFVAVPTLLLATYCFFCLYETYDFEGWKNRAYYTKMLSLACLGGAIYNGIRAYNIIF
ncbi:hypothetical protein QGN29_14310 [Temperatibacter marinus]|uniref:Uncharacterized protein n=1 Tax=Temperatibacter marinus TaxID=1456591 RepID=A0AA52H921_9PROT|nr:hypothetical protein [Temperatibacter marinus]WND02721.1 hypothetical protein QGN29_14310 [Temperatibacter marinus]